jgi:hypothetical protein
MLLALYGPFAIGKSTFLDTHMDYFADNLPEWLNLSVVLADYADEYRYMKISDTWQVVHDKPRWKGKKEDKLPYIADMVRDRKRLWIVESARYFGGLQDIFIEYHNKFCGGVKFMVFRTDLNTARKFMIERCEFRNKTFNEEYWTPQRLAYESMGRYINVVNNSYTPAGVKCDVMPVSYDRREWDMVKGKIRAILQWDDTWWYYDKDSSNKG